MKNLIDEFLDKFIFIYNKERIGNFLVGIFFIFLGSFLGGFGIYIIINLISGYIWSVTGRIVWFFIIFIICMIINFFACFAEDSNKNF